MSKKLYVGNLAYGVTEAQLQEMFGEYGSVASVKIITDRETNRSKGFGFVEFSDDADVEGAISALDGTDFQGRALRVAEARPQQQSRGGRGGGGRFRGGSGGGGGRGRY